MRLVVHLEVGDLVGEEELGPLETALLDLILTSPVATLCRRVTVEVIPREPRRAPATTSPVPGRWVPVVGCRVSHPYGEGGWRPGRGDTHEHWEPR